MDRKRGKAIMKRANKLFRKCRKKQPELRRLYREKQEEFTSIEFWNDYLGI